MQFGRFRFTDSVTLTDGIDAVQVISAGTHDNAPSVSSNIRLAHPDFLEGKIIDSDWADLGFQ
eukprot:3337944-Pyramimonas_sp.AAC.1